MVLWAFRTIQLHCEFVSIREEDFHSRLELAFFGRPAFLNERAEGLQDLVHCCVPSEFLQMGCGDVAHQHDFKSVVFSGTLGYQHVWGS